MAGAGVAGAGVAAVVEQADTTRATAATESRMVRFIVWVPSGEVTGLGLRRGVPRHLTVPPTSSPPPHGWMGDRLRGRATGHPARRCGGHPGLAQAAVPGVAVRAACRLATAAMT